MALKVLLVTQEPPLNDTDVASGNAIREKQIRTALSDAGHHIERVWLARRGQSRTAGAFTTRDELQGILLRSRAEIVLVNYWELLALLPFDLEIPVILDFVAPRPLEELFESPRTVRAGLRRLRHNLTRCDLLMVGNDRQRDLIVNTLIEAGFDLRKDPPVLVVPLGAELAQPPQSTPENGWLLVTGGVSWPWRDESGYLEELARVVRQNPANRIVSFGGDYRWRDEDEAQSAPSERSGAQTHLPAGIEHQPLLPYPEFSEFLTRHAHLGVELAEWNVERACSQSFRSLEFLRCGIPLLCNDYLPIAPLVRRYRAGWLVSSPDQLSSTWAEMVSHPQDWLERSRGARQLVEQELTPERSVRPLISWLENPRKAARLDSLPRREIKPLVLGKPRLTERLIRQFRLARQVTLRKLFSPHGRGSGIVLVTRGDLFPADHGAAVRTIETARAIGATGLEVGLVTDDRGHWYQYKDGDFERQRFPLWLRLFGWPAPIVKLLHYSSDIPHSNAFLYLPLTDHSFTRRILWVSKRIRAGGLQAEFPAYAKPCLEVRDNLDYPVVMVEHNVEYDRLRAQVPELTDQQYDTLRAIELDLCNACDAVVCVSDNDRQKLTEDGVRPELLHTIAHGVDLKSYQRPALDGVREKFGIPTHEPLMVYHGTFSYPPNRQAIQVFADTLLPGLESRGIRCHVLAVGREPPADSPHPRIHFSGSVEHVAPWLKAADLAVIPLSEGGGTRMKIIDCFAAGLPVISTSKGIEGIPVEAGRQALVIDDWGSMIDSIEELLSDARQRESLAASALKMADSLDWAQVGRQFKNLFASL